MVTVNAVKLSELIGTGAGIMSLMVLGSWR